MEKGFVLDGYSRLYAIVVAESWWQELDKSYSSHINSQERMNSHIGKFY